MTDIAHPGGLGLPDVDQGPKIIIATAITTSAALIAVLARFYVRIFLIRNVGWDDYAMGLTMLLSACGFAIIVPEVKYGAGRHQAYVQETAVEAMRLNFATQCIYMWAIGLAKVSIGLFLVRFASRKVYKNFIWSIIVVVALYTTICFLTLIFQCKDIRSNWDTSIQSKCFKPKQILTLSYANTALNIVSDLIFAILPVFMLRHLQVNIRVKASLICILGLGIFACAAACAKLSTVQNYGHTTDSLWEYTNLTIWVVTECNTGIVAGTLPTLKPLFKSILGTYAPQTKSRQYHDSQRYTMHTMNTMSRTKAQFHAHRTSNLSIIEHDLDLKMPRARIANVNANYAGSERSNSSEERILPTTHGDRGIFCTTEVSISHAHEPQEESTSTSAPKLARMGSVGGVRVNGEDRV
ncbi:uncharacterized protein N7515_002717 [Penicillium bovifimosum]|uniref:Rhodopsin domain-containing protein n=1 Tax=Penicillium bovifimosum TaxID=126998 RepID=A0A9W9HC22_9EURO|nr:uncharacterized protein N7515_002717 [Penicillium bovifimosum]KAJ5143930.1 hypothetical protein N7515_002717 [Penicillium bovifimosum]